MNNIERILEDIKNEIFWRDSRIKFLKEENKRLKDEHYKDSEMQSMESELKEAKDNLCRGFPISKEEKEKIREWQLKHDAEKHGLKTLEQRLEAGGCIGGRLTYHFIPTSIGVVGEVECSCGEKFTFQDL